MTRNKHWLFSRHLYHQFSKETKHEATLKTLAGQRGKLGALLGWMKHTEALRLISAHGGFTQQRPGFVDHAWHVVNVWWTSAPAISGMAPHSGLYVARSSSVVRAVLCRWEVQWHPWSLSVRPSPSLRCGSRRCLQALHNVLWGGMEESKSPVWEPLISLYPQTSLWEGWSLRVPVHSWEDCTSVCEWLRQCPPASELQDVDSNPVPYRWQKQVELTWLWGRAVSAGLSGVVATQELFSWDSVLRVIFGKNKKWPPWEFLGILPMGTACLLCYRSAQCWSYLGGNSGSWRFPGDECSFLMWRVILILSMFGMVQVHFLFLLLRTK